MNIETMTGTSPVNLNLSLDDLHRAVDELNRTTVRPLSADAPFACGCHGCHGCRGCGCEGCRGCGCEGCRGCGCEGCRGCGCRPCRGCR